MGTLRQVAARPAHAGRAPTIRGPGPGPSGLTLLYARVSSVDQKSDLERQRARLLTHAEARGWTDVTLLADLGSGLNFKKPGLLRLLDLLLRRKVRRLAVENKGRLLRFGAGLIFRLCHRLGVEVVIVDAPSASNFEAELARDVLEIITVFSARLYGARSRRHLENAGGTSCPKPLKALA